MTRADELWDAVKAAKLNEGAVDSLLRSHLDQPAFYPEWRDDLHRRAMERGGVFDQTGPEREAEEVTLLGTLRPVVT